MPESVKVVVLPEAEEEAYNMGYDRFEGHNKEIEALRESGETITPEEKHNLEGFHSSAEYANNVLPTLRAMAGFEDSGYGTYQINGKVVIVEFPGDRPMDGELMESQYVFESLSDSYHNGIYDAIEGNERGETLEL